MQIRRFNGIIRELANREDLEMLNFAAGIYKPAIRRKACSQTLIAVEPMSRGNVEWIGLILTRRRCPRAKDSNILKLPAAYSSVNRL